MAKKKSKTKPIIIGAAVIGGLLLIPVIINKLRPGGTVPGYQGIGAYVAQPLTELAGYTVEPVSKGSFGAYRVTRFPKVGAYAVHRRGVY